MSSDTSKDYCLMALEETLLSIAAAEKDIKMNKPTDRAFGELRGSVINVFRGLTVRIAENDEAKFTYLRKIQDAVANKSTTMRDGTADAIINETLKFENQQLQTKVTLLENQLNGYKIELGDMADALKRSKEVEKANLCLNCQKKPKDVLLLPCKCVFFCSECAATMRECLCNEKIVDKIIFTY